MMIVCNAYCANSLNYLTVKQDINKKYLLGLFNSKLLNFVYSKFSTNSNVNGYEIDNLPFPKSSNLKITNRVIKLVDKIISITKDEDYLQIQQKQLKVKALEAEIDQHVYKLYGLTPEEIRIVDGYVNTKT